MVNRPVVFVVGGVAVVPVAPVSRNVTVEPPETAYDVELVKFPEVVLRYTVYPVAPVTAFQLTVFSFVFVAYAVFVVGVTAPVVVRPVVGSTHAVVVPMGVVF